MIELANLDVVFTIDERYIRHFAVACTSLLETNKNHINRIYLIHEMPGNKLLSQTLDYLQANYPIDIVQLTEIPRSLDSLFVNGYISKSTYLRLLLAEMIPSDIYQVLFLDADIVVRGDLSGLKELSFHNDGMEYMLYAADHNLGEESLREMWGRFGVEASPYFNAGVLLINLKAWRENCVTEQLLNTAAKYHHLLTWHDQDVLNIVFRKQWALLSGRYNVYSVPMKGINESEYRIIHYIGSSKPWHYMNRHPYKKLYWKYHALTPFRACIPEGRNLSNMIKRWLPSKLKVLVKKAIRLHE